MKKTLHLALHVLRQEAREPPSGLRLVSFLPMLFCFTCSGLPVVADDVPDALTAFLGCMGVRQ